MKLLKAFDWVTFWLSVLLVAAAVILLALAQRVNEEPVLYWATHFLAAMVKGLDPKPVEVERD